MSPQKPSLRVNQVKKKSLAEIAFRVNNSYLITKNKFKINKKIFSNILIKMHLSINNRNCNGILVTTSTYNKCSNRLICSTTNSNAINIGTPCGARWLSKLQERISSKKHIEIMLEVPMDNSLIP